MNKQGPTHADLNCTAADPCREHQHSEEERRRAEKAKCEHMEFNAFVNVNRVSDMFPMAFVAEIRIECKHCGERFRFKGLTAGISFERPLTEVDGCELRAPIEPEGQPRLMKSAVIEMPPKEAKSS